MLLINVNLPFLWLKQCFRLLWITIEIENICLIARFLIFCQLNLNAKYLYMVFAMSPSHCDILHGIWALLCGHLSCFNTWALWCPGTTLRRGCCYLALIPTTVIWELECLDLSFDLKLAEVFLLPKFLLQNCFNTSFA